MLDNRIYTFLELCDVMNYHKTAENLSMTQPAVTQHIKYLEQLYRCKLFSYSKKQLSKTSQCLALEHYARSVVSLSNSVEQALAIQEKIKIRIGATKTIGEYTLEGVLGNLLTDERYEVTLIVDNTERLLDQLNHFALDLLLVEGYVDKIKYKYQKISKEKIVGICASDHPFAHRTVAVEEVLQEHIVLREMGSGTRAVFENYLLGSGYTIEAFAQKTFLSSNKLIERVVESGWAISFTYDVIPRENEKMATFQLENCNLTHEFNYVYLNEGKANQVIDLLRPHH